MEDAHRIITKNVGKEELKKNKNIVLATIKQVTRLMTGREYLFAVEVYLSMTGQEPPVPKQKDAAMTLV